MKASARPVRVRRLEASVSDLLETGLAATAARRRARIRRGLLVAIAVLYVVSIPWYREADATPQVLLGLPDWVTLAVGCYIAAAFLNAAAWLMTDVSDDIADEAAPGASGDRRP